MENQDYRFEPLTEDNERTWLETAAMCAYAPANALDAALIEQQIREKRADCNVIIYETDNNRPIALVPGEIMKKGLGGLFGFNILKSQYGGLLISSDNLADALSIKEFVFEKVIKGYYRNIRKIDCMYVTLPPKIMIETPMISYKLVPFHQGRVELNSILCAELGDDLLDKFKPNVRHEIVKGLENIKTARVLYKEDKDLMQYLVDLDSQKALELGIRPVPVGYFKTVIKSEFCHPVVAVLNGQPAASMVYTCSNGIGTFQYNSSSQEGKKLFINKALLFMSMQKCSEKRAKFFVLGKDLEYSKKNGKRQIEQVAFFKKSFSTHSFTACTFDYPLTMKGLILAGMNFIRKDQNGR